MEELREQLSLDEPKIPATVRLDKCNQWLSDNPNHELAEKLRRCVIPSLLRQKELERYVAERSLISVLEERSLTSVLVNSDRPKFGYPALSDLTNSLPCFPSRHEHASLREVSVVQRPQLFESIQTHFMGVEFWRAPFVWHNRDCDSESLAQQLVVQLLQAVLVGLKLDQCIGVAQNRTLAGTECDVLLVFKYNTNRLPFAVVEVKKPGNSLEGQKLIFEGIENDGGNRVAGELYDEMKAVELFGFPEHLVTGMIATGNHFRIVGLDDYQPTPTKDTAEMEKLMDTTKVRERLQQLTDTSMGQNQEAKDATPHSSIEMESPQHVQGSADFILDAEIPEVVERKLWAGEIVPPIIGENAQQAIRDEVRQSGKEIITLLVLFVLKACTGLAEFLECNEIPLDPVKIRPRMPCRILVDTKKGGVVFSFSTIGFKSPVNFDCFDPGLETIYVIHHLGTGKNGNCCLGTSKTGASCCAVKFFHKTDSNPQTSQENQADQAKEECQYWNIVYKKKEGRGDALPHLPPSRVLSVPGGHCLVMPYLHTIRKDERHTLLENGDMEKALTDFAKRGYIHCDTKWRHFGRFGNDKENRHIFLLDLGNIKETDDQKEINDWLIGALEYLKLSAGERPSKATPKKRKFQVQNAD